MNAKLPWLTTAGIAMICALTACQAEPTTDRSAGADTLRGMAPADTAGRASDVALVPVEQYIAEGAHAHGLTRAQVIARFGAPAETRSRPVPNRHDPTVIDSIVQLAYPGAQYTYYVVTAGPGEILDGAEITANEHLRHASPGIGTSAHDLRAAYGEPLRADGDELEYDCRTCEVPQPVTFVFGDGRVERIRFDYYVD